MISPYCCGRKVGPGIGLTATSENSVFEVRRLALGLADPARFELTTSAFGGQRSIQLSYGSAGAGPYATPGCACKPAGIAPLARLGSVERRGRSRAIKVHRKLARPRAAKGVTSLRSRSSGLRRREADRARQDVTAATARAHREGSELRPCSDLPVVIERWSPASARIPERCALAH